MRWRGFIVDFVNVEDGELQKIQVRLRLRLAGDARNIMHPRPAIRPGDIQFAGQQHLFMLGFSQ